MDIFVLAWHLYLDQKRPEHKGGNEFYLLGQCEPESGCVCVFAAVIGDPSYKLVCIE